MRKMLLLSLPVVLAGWQAWGPTWSEVTDAKWSRNEMFRRPAIIERIDELSPLSGAVIKIEPGRNDLTLRGPDTGWLDGGGRNNLVIETLPCKRYYVDAQYTSNASPDWKPMVDYVWDIAGCKA